MEITEAKDYREFLRETLLSKKKVLPKRYTFLQLSRACRVQKTYISNVLLGRGHLNSDQLYSACEYLNLGGQETEYLMTFAERQKSISSTRKRYLDAKLAQAKSSLLQTTKVLPEAKERAKHLEKYYSDVTAQIFRIFLTIPEIQAQPAKIREKLQLSDRRFNEIIELLESLGLVSLNKSEIRSVETDLHLPAGESIFPSFHLMREIVLLQRFLTNLDQRDYNFSVVFSADEETREKIRVKLLDLVKSVHTLVGVSAKREVFSMSLNLGKIS